MAKIRVSRVGEQIKKEIVDIVRTEIKDPRVGFVTITGVEASGDLQHATVFVSVLGNDDQRKGSLDALQKATGFIRAEVGRRIRLRRTPELHFKLDTSLDYSTRISEVLRDIKEGETTDDPGSETGV
ncbi:30S ribosome-binding factor RbfA [Tumebacillus sp. ITR2]|jgi:ribosome-binding factor A|uniref:Ribosome-binding factor A n=1 Tax=Tumebacillus amylolyticus TaxID=2801339 RepID=A0ABS1JF94_9BACL|nr:30S ribosome-binding factor RbfA [Tumebacillus amylolyticus]MBL0388957.1 30S ribosome-binding factor RbfA [Tumebacillus amylolyticus]